MSVYGEEVEDNHIFICFHPPSSSPSLSSLSSSSSSMLLLSYRKYDDIVFLKSFHQLRRHLLFQHGIIRDAAHDIATLSRDKSSTHRIFSLCVNRRDRSSSFSSSSSSSSFLQERLRRRMWIAVITRNMSLLKDTVAKARQLEPQFPRKWYRNAKLEYGGWRATSQRNPLHVACASPHQDICHRFTTFLLEAGFDPNSLDKLHRKSSFFRLRHWYELAATLFLVHDDPERTTPFAASSFSAPSSSSTSSTASSSSLSSYFIDDGPRGLFKHTLLTPLHIAVAQGNLDLVRILLDAGANPNVSAISNVLQRQTPPLFWATNIDVCHLLLMRGANQLYVVMSVNVLVQYDRQSVIYIYIYI
jgi:hypothetical protein